MVHGAFLQCTAWFNCLPTPSSLSMDTFLEAVSNTCSLCVCFHPYPRMTCVLSMYMYVHHRFLTWSLLHSLWQCCSAFLFSAACRMQGAMLRVCSQQAMSVCVTIATLVFQTASMLFDHCAFLQSYITCIVK
eukprot:scpid4313/ scgid21174/ 